MDLEVLGNPAERHNRERSEPAVTDVLRHVQRLYRRYGVLEPDYLAKASEWVVGNVPSGIPQSSYFSPSWPQDMPELPKSMDALVGAFVAFREALAEEEGNAEPAQIVYETSMYHYQLASDALSHLSEGQEVYVPLSEDDE